MLRRWFAVPTLAAFLSLTLSAGRARADAPPDQPPAAVAGGDDLMNAQLHFQAGKDAFSGGDFQTAIREWKAAQAIKPSPKLDYNIGIAYEKLARPRAALKYFRKYLQQLPDAPNRAEVEAKIPVLEQQAQAQPPAAEDGQQQPPPATAQPQYAQGGQYQQQPQYNYQQQQPAGYRAPPPPPPEKKSGSHWWIVFPIIGGVIILLYLFWYVETVNSYSSSYGASGLTSFGATSATGMERDTALFRF